MERISRQEFIRRFANTKVYVDGKSRDIQEQLFKAGYAWNFIANNRKVGYEWKPFLYIRKKFFNYGENAYDFKHDQSGKFREVAANDILDVEIIDPDTEW